MLRNLVKKSIIARRILRRWRLSCLQPDWEPIIARDGEIWRNARSAPKKKRVLIATSVGAHLPCATLESFLAVALTLRETEVHFLLCDGVLPACMDCSLGITIGEKKLAEETAQAYLCKACFRYTAKMFSTLGLKIHRYSDYLSDKDKQEAREVSSAVSLDKIAGYTYKGISVGNHAMAGALRFYARGDLNEEPYAGQIASHYLNASVLTAIATQKLLDTFKFDTAVFHHGIYVPQGIVGEVCRQNKVPVVNWSIAYRKSSFIFSHNDTYHHTLMTEPVDSWKEMRWNDRMEEAILSYLKSRWDGSRDWIWFHEKPSNDVTRFAMQMGIDFSKPCVGLLTNVMWDAQIHYPARAFPDMLAWLIYTIEYFRSRPELQLIIRVHPAEIWGKQPSRQKVTDELKKHVQNIPPNVFVIPPEARISTYAVMMQCNTVIIYGTKTGVELASYGIPVVVAGEAWIRNKGLSIDATSEPTYRSILDTIPLKNRLDSKMLREARKYAFHFFFRRMIPLSYMKPVKGWPLYSMEIESLSKILQGNDTAVDIICNGILNGYDFVYPKELEFR
ncbi:MAG: capsule biosynthesis protein [Candidatus Auribacterota bacterium]|jgi:hypothetical protein|nr:capsule biosynthesis protein [Candidatus Auribacterota bacterium]